MVSKLESPIDDQTGIPLPIIPDIGAILPLNNGAAANEHHAFHAEGPTLHTFLRHDLGGIAVRNCRIQLVSARYHNQFEKAYHNFFKGPPIPENWQDQFAVVLPAVAGYVPSKGVDLSSGEPVIRSMTTQERQILVMPGELRPPTPQQIERYQMSKNLGHLCLEDVAVVLRKRREEQAQFGYRHFHYGYEAVRAFFSEVVLTQDLSHVKFCIREKFVEQMDITEGLKLLGIAARQSVEDTKSERTGQPLMKFYKDLQTYGSLHPRMPASPASLVKYKLGDDNMRRALLPELKSRLLETAA